MPGDMDMDRRCSSSSNEGQVVAELISNILIQSVKAFFPKKQELEETLTLYYKLDGSSPSLSNPSVTNFVTKPLYLYMTDSTFSKQNSDIISYSKTRTPPNPPVFDKNMYNKTIGINSGSSFIQLVINYPEEGVEIKSYSQEFAISAATGKFRNFTKCIINYNDENPNRRTRTIILSTC